MATQTLSMEDQLKELNARVKNLLAQDAAPLVKPEEPQPYQSEKLRLELGATLRGALRRYVSLKTDLEMTEYKGFLTSVFILVSRTPEQSIHLHKVHAWLKRIEAEV